MKKYIGILAIVLLAGCDKGNELICTQTGELFYRGITGQTSTAMTSTQATSLYNSRQICSNQPDGTIIVKFRDQGNDN